MRLLERGAFGVEIGNVRELSFDEIRRLYKAYLQKQNISSTSVYMADVDAFYLWRKGNAELFWNVITAANFEAEAKSALIKVLQEHSCENVNLLINEYMSHLRMFRVFLDTDMNAENSMVREANKAIVNRCNCITDKINRITVDYHRVTKIKPKQPISETAEYVTWDYTEQLIVDRESESIEHIQNIGTGCIVSRKYKVEGGVEGLFDDLDANCLFDNIVGNPLDVIETPNETKDYIITIDSVSNPHRVIQGTYDKNGLPVDWAEFMETVFSFMRFYGWGEILDPSVYNKVKRRKNEYIYCSITFDEGYKSYYYITNDDSIEVGDYVLVPVGKDNRTAVVEVVNIEYFSEEDVPLPVEITKHIIRKYTDDDLELKDS